MYLATDLAQIGDKDNALKEANRALELNPDDPLMLYNATCFYSQLGEKESALKSLEKAIGVGYANYEWLEKDTDLDPIRKEPKFDELIAKINKK